MIEFVLVFMMGVRVIDQTQTFQDIDRCLYFATRMSKQRDYRAICKPVFIDPSKTQVYK